VSHCPPGEGEQGRREGGKVEGKRAERGNTTCPFMQAVLPLGGVLAGAEMGV